VLYTYACTGMENNTKLYTDTMETGAKANREHSSYMCTKS